MPLPRALMSWSSGKDSAWALYEQRMRGDLDVVGLLTTVTEPYRRVSMHGVRESVLAQQAARVGLPLYRVPLPSPCDNAEYQARMAAVVAEQQDRGVTHVIFGDLFLEDVRAYREEQMARAGLIPVFPLWRRNTLRLADTMLASGLEAVVTVVDPGRLDPSLSGRPWNREFVDGLPPGVDPCGERGEFHTLVTSGPMFSSAIPVSIGETVERDGFVFTDVALEPATGHASRA